jgi:ribosomal 30S subunit maturation factor RimM
MRNSTTKAVVIAIAMAIGGSAHVTLAADAMQSEDEYRTSKLVGAAVYNEANEKIGSIEDIVLKADGAMDEVVLSVGGFLGIGDKFVSVPFGDLQISRDGSSLKVVTKGTKESLKGLPDYKFHNS